MTKTTITNEQLRDFLTSRRNIVIDAYNKSSKHISMKDYFTIVMDYFFSMSDIKKRRTIEGITYGYKYLMEAVAEANKEANKKSYIEVAMDYYCQCRRMNAVSTFVKRYGTATAAQCEAIYNAKYND